MNKIIILISLFLTLTACNSKKSSSDTPSDSDLNDAYCTLNICPSGPPTNLNYAGVTTLSLTKDVLIQDVSPTFEPNFYLYTFRVNPALPAGLSLDASTGRISGKPTIAAAERTYRVILDNRLIGEQFIIAGGLAVYDIKMTVNEKNPKQFDYLLRDQKAQYQSLKGQNDAIARPAAITNLIIDRNINMEPIELSNHELGQMSCYNVNTLTPLTLTEFNNLDDLFDCKKKGLNIECKNQTATGLKIFDCVRNEPVMSIDLLTTVYVPVVCDKYSAAKILDCRELGRSATTFSISPSLPAGLVFNNQDGRISGSPISEQLAQTYRITAANTGGSKFYDLNITVRGVAPTDLAYLFPNVSYKSGLDIVNNNPLYSGDAASSYSIAPSLPQGLFFNTLTGFISGNPGQIISNNNYVITATNSWGSASANVTISVIDNITDVSVGEHHSCAIRNKLATCWGKNNKGQLGYESATVCSGLDCSLSAVKVRQGSFTLEAKKIATSLNTSCAILSDNRVACWGDNSNGQLGTDSADAMSREPQYVDIDSEDNNLMNVKQLVAGRNHFCALTTEGKVYCWGDNSNGQISITGLTSALYSFQTLGETGTSFLTNVSNISSGFDHNCAVLQNSKVYCWGNNSSGQFGNGSLASSRLPVKMLESLGVEFLNNKKVYAGSNFTLIEKTNNMIYAVGNNDYQQLASSALSSQYPQLTNKSSSNNSPLINLSSIKTGLNSFCFLENNLAYCLGQNNGDFGNDDTVLFSQNPTIVRNEDDSANLENIDVLSNGFGSHRCVSIVGNAYCFGNNDFGQLGDSSQNSSVNPVKVNFN